MLGEGGTPLSRLQAAAREFQEAREERGVDLKGLRGVIDGLEAEFAHDARVAQRSGDHLVGGNIGAALKTAIDGLAKRLGQEDIRTPKQRRVDAFTEIVYKSLDEGKLPQRNGVRPHITITTTLEGLKGELGAAASELETGMPISSKTVQRLACDGTLSRVLKAESRVVDVGRATRAGWPAQPRGLKASYTRCCGPGCDRPINWTSAHHIEFWSQGGPSDLPNLLPLCYYHHRLVHEGGWQAVKVGEEVRFIPPDRVNVRRARGPGARWPA